MSEHQRSPEHQVLPEHQRLTEHQGLPVTPEEGSNLVSFCIEGKKQGYPIDDLKFQLWANMFLVGVTDCKIREKIGYKKSIF